jgi:hypothetical protein
MAFALDHLGKQVTLINRDPVPGPLVPFPGTDRIVVADHVDETSTRRSSWSAARSIGPA